MDSKQTMEPTDSLLYVTENGVETAYESLGVILRNDIFYAVAIPADTADDEAADAVILRLETQNGKMIYVPEENPETADAVFDDFQARYADDFDFDDTDEETAE